MGRRVSFVRKRQQPTLLHLLWGFKCPKVKVWTQNHNHSFGQIHLHFFKVILLFFRCKSLQSCIKMRTSFTMLTWYMNSKNAHFYCNIVCNITHCSKLECSQKSFHTDSILFDEYVEHKILNMYSTFDVCLLITRSVLNNVKTNLMLQVLKILKIYTF